MRTKNGSAAKDQARDTLPDTIRDTLPRLNVFDLAFLEDLQKDPRRTKQFVIRARDRKKK